MKCQICQANTAIKNTICDTCLDLFEIKKYSSNLKLSWIDQVHIIYNYMGLLKKLILAYKFANKRYLYKVFGELICDYIIDHGLYKDIDIIISVPLHQRTYKKRGYNQVELIEDYIVEKLGLEAEKNNLVKIKYTKEQARLDLEERKTNLEGAFRLLNEERIKNKNILLLDDLITSGSTIDTCGKVLKAARAKSIIALSLASAR